MRYIYPILALAHHLADVTRVLDAYVQNTAIVVRILAESIRE